MQNTLSSFGLMHYKPPAQNIYHTNYQIVVNLIPEINSLYRETFTFGELTNNIQTVDDSLNRYLGFIEELKADKKDSLRNPIEWLKEGISIIINFPLALLTSFQILDEEKYNSIRNHIIFKILQFSLTLLTILATAVTLFVNWDQLFKMLGLE